jgi:hypothetical protein
MWKYGAPAALMALVVLRKIAAFEDRIRRVALRGRYDKPITGPRMLAGELTAQVG